MYHKGIGNSLRGHRGILKREIIINLINGDFRSRLGGSIARCHGCGERRVRAPGKPLTVLFRSPGSKCQAPGSGPSRGESRVPGQSTQGSSMAIPGREVWRRPEAGKAGAKAPRRTR